METKFIEGTNQQYSIREDSVIVRHYYKSRWKTITYKDVILTKKIQYILNKNTKLTLGHKFIMFKYFGVKCKIKKCNNKISSLLRKKCDDCAYKHKTILQKKLNQEAIINVNKAYIASNLKISVKDLSNKMYNHHKQLTLFKRQLAQTHNISINSIK